MNILVFNWRDIKNPEAGGAESHLHEISKRIVTKGHNVTLVSSKYSGCKNKETIDGINIIRIGHKLNFNFIVPIYYLLKLRKQKFDVVIDDISKVPICTPLYIRRPILAIVHHIHGHTLFKELPFIMASYVWLSEKYLLSFYKDKTIITVSDSTKNELVEMKIPDKNILVIHNGNDCNGSEPIIKSKTPLIIYIGRIKPYKRLDHLIMAFKKVKENVKDSKLIIAGKGDKKYLNYVAARLGLDSCIEFLDHLSEKEKLKLLHEAWIFATPSMKEGWGITVIEANSCGTPAIGYDVPGLRDSIQHGYNGLLTKEGDIDSFAENIIDILENEKSRHILSKNALNWSKQFNWDKTADLFLDHINNFLNCQCYI